MEGEKIEDKLTCPVARSKELTFKYIAQLLGLLNIRPYFQKKWKDYDIDVLYKVYKETGYIPFTEKPDERKIFVRYALSRISIFTTREFLKKEYPYTKKNLHKNEIGEGTDEDIEEKIKKTFKICVREIFGLYTHKIRGLTQDTDTSKEEVKLIRMLDKNDLDELLELSTTSGTLPTIASTIGDFQSLLIKNGYIDIDAYKEGIIKDPIIAHRALSNLPSVALYFAKKFPEKLRGDEFQKAADIFMQDGYPIIQFNPSNLQREYLYSRVEFEKYAKSAISTHAQLQNRGYSGCPLLYKKEGGNNLIIALHLKIADMIFGELAQSIQK